MLQELERAVTRTPAATLDFVSMGSFRVPVELANLGGGPSASVSIGGQQEPTMVVFGDPGSEPLLRVFTLEGFGLAADPVNRRLIPVPGLLKLA